MKLDLWHCQECGLTDQVASVLTEWHGNRDRAAELVLSWPELADAIRALNAEADDDVAG